MTEPLRLIVYMLINLICGVIAMVIHELPKAIAAHFLTHPLHRSRRFKMVKPSKFIDPVGLVLFTVSTGISGMGIGWQKPYNYNPNKLVEKHRSLLPIMLAGEITSIVIVIGLFPLYQYVATNDFQYFITYFVGILIRMNFIIFIVNLLPVPPLDMGNIVYAYSPNHYFKLIQNQRYIHSAFILVVALGILENISAVIFSYLANILL